MPLQTAKVIDLQAYRQSREQAERPSVAVSLPMQPMLMWVPYWGFVPFMAMGISGNGG